MRRCFLPPNEGNALLGSGSDTADPRNSQATHTVLTIVGIVAPERRRERERDDADDDDIVVVVNKYCIMADTE